VEVKETLFSLSRRYQVSIEQINVINPQLIDGLKVGQELLIPIAEQSSSPFEGSRPTHFVDIGETLFSISRKYGFEVGDIRAWNNLKSSDLSVGQEIMITAPPKDLLVSNSSEDIAIDTDFDSYHIVEQKETLISVSQKYAVSIDSLKQLNGLTSNEISVGQRLLLRKEAKEISDDLKSEPILSDTIAIELDIDTVVVVKPKEIVPIYAADVNQFNTRVIKEGELEKVVEEGLAMVIENSSDTKKYLALHRTAKIGTVMQVINMANNMNIYVRVVGKLIKLSRTANEKLRAVDSQFPVQITYIP
jgi:LysM repeat protein